MEESQEKIKLVNSLNILSSLLKLRIGQSLNIQIGKDIVTYQRTK